jgi:nucleotide-binding universal stress UspA family protein
MRILLAIDASPDSQHAAHMIRHCAQPPSLDILNVVDVDALRHAYISPEVPESYLDTYRQEVSEVAEKVLHEMKAELEPLSLHVRLIADSGDAAESIIQTAEESRSDLIIVGQRGMTSSPSFLLGGVSQKVATYAPCSVLVVKDDPIVLDRIVLAVDGSEASHKAVEFLRRPPFKAPLRVHVVTVWPQGAAMSSAHPGKRSGRSELKEVVRTKGEELLRTVATELTQGPYTVQTELLRGDPAFAILDAAIRQDARMVVVGARGLTAIKRFLLGSVCQKVLVHALCSVLIVR